MLHIELDLRAALQEAVEAGRMVKVRAVGVRSEGAWQLATLQYAEQPRGKGIKFVDGCIGVLCVGRPSASRLEKIFNISGLGRCEGGTPPPTLVRVERDAGAVGFRPPKR